MAEAMVTEIRIELLPKQSALDARLVQEITSLVNQVYAVAEKGLWMEAAARTSISEVSTLIEAGQIAIAGMGSRIVGCIRIQKLDENTGEFGMLTALQEFRGTGVGRKLVAFSESHSKALGLRTMQLELLVPQTWTLESKEFLKIWYSRIGYKKVRTGSIQEAYPQLAPLLATDCDFMIYHKSL